MDRRSSGPLLLRAPIDNKLFVSTYQLQLPDLNTLEKFLLRQLDADYEDAIRYHSRKVGERKERAARTEGPEN